MHRKIAGSALSIVVGGLVGLWKPAYLVATLVVLALYLLWTWDVFANFVADTNETEKATTLGDIRPPVRPQRSSLEPAKTTVNAEGTPAPRIDVSVTSGKSVVMGITNTGGRFVLGLRGRIAKASKPIDNPHNFAYIDREVKGGDDVSNYTIATTHATRGRTGDVVVHREYMETVQSWHTFPGVVEFDVEMTIQNVTKTDRHTIRRCVVHVKASGDMLTATVETVA